MRSIRVFRHYMRSSLLILAGVETLIFVLCFYTSARLRWWLLDAEPTFLAWELFLQGFLVAAVMLSCLAAMGLYEARLPGGIQGSLLRIAIAMAMGSVVIAAISFAFPGLSLWRSILGFSVVLSFVVVSATRLIFFYTNPAIFRRRVILFGASDDATRLLRSEEQGFEVVGVIPAPAETQVPADWPLLAHDEPLRKLAARLNVDEIVLALQDRRGKLPVNQLLDCKMFGIEVTDLLSFVEMEKGLVKLDLLTPSWLVFSDGFQHSGFSMALKRLFDVIASLVLLVLLWPIMLIAAMAVWVESGFAGPVFYRQTRVGEGGKPFDVVKFRSMRVDAEADGKVRWATKNDSRITRVGGFMRKSRIDELPQLFTVLKGDMSFVGPRPERPEFVAMLASKYPYYAERHLIKPGVTGWAQLSYPYGSSEEDALRKLEYDLYYIKNYSLFLDLLILLETVEVVLFRKGAV